MFISPLFIMYVRVCVCFQDMESASTPINGWMNEENMVNLHNYILLRNEKNDIICSKMESINFILWKWELLTDTYVKNFSQNQKIACFLFQW